MTPRSFFAAFVRRLLISDQLPRLLIGFKLVYKLCTVISILMYAVEEPDTLPAGVKRITGRDSKHSKREALDDFL